MRQEMTWQVRRLISAPVVEPESVAGQSPAATLPSGLHRGFQDPIVGQRPAVRAVRRLISTAQRSPKVRLAMATWPSGDQGTGCSRSRTPDFHRWRVETVNDVLVLPAWHSVGSRQPSPPAIPAPAVE